MAPFNEAISVKDVTNTNEPQPEKGRIYEGTLDPTWNVASFPCGGYVLAQILQACIQYQESTGSQLDPLHISAHFLRPTSSKVPFKIHVRPLKVSKGFSNLVAELFQEETLRITTHSIFGTNAPSSPSHSQTSHNNFTFTLDPHSSPAYARRPPHTFHPARGTPSPHFPILTFHNHLAWCWDDALVQRNAPGHPSRDPVAQGHAAEKDNGGGAGLEWAGYLEFTGPGERLSNTYIPFLADMFINTINLLPASAVPGSTGDSNDKVDDNEKKKRDVDTGPGAGFWFPTMTLAVEFKFPLSSLSPAKHSTRTVASYSNGRFINHPDGRHDIYVEIWSSPAGIGEGEEREGWRDEQICLATAHQMALALPMPGKGAAKKTVTGVEKPKL